MYKIYLLITLFLIFTKALSQEGKYLDSLKQQLTTNLPDSVKARLYHTIGGYYFYRDNDSVLFYAGRAANLAKKNKLMPILIGSNSIIFVTQGLKRNDVAAIKMFFETQNLVEVYKDTTVKQHFLQLAGLLYNSLEDYQTSLKYFFAIVPLLRDSSDRFDYDGVTSRVISENYYKLNKLDSALIYATKVLQTLRYFGVDHSVVHRVLGNIYRKKGETTLALKELHRALFLAKTEENLNVEIIKSQLGLAQTHFATGNGDSSLYYCNAVLHSPMFNAFAEEKLQTLKLLKEIYQTKNSRDSALKYMGLLLDFRDSIYNVEKIRTVQRAEVEQTIKNKEAEANRQAYRSRIRFYALLAALAVFSCVAILLWRHNQQRQKAYSLLQKQKKDTDLQKEKTEQALQELKTTQAQLIQSEKMASLGELTAGIAHEIQNPLNFVNNFSEVNTELITELEEEAAKENISEIKVIAADIKENEQKISFHGKRADAIVKNMLEHSRRNTGDKQATDINALVDEYLRLSYHGLRAKDKSFNAKMETAFDENIGKVSIVPQDIGRVLLNLFNNGFYAVHEKAKKLVDGYEPTISVSTKKFGDKMEIVVKDNGMGISKSLADKIFQPFFTTKPTGQGTGLGLSLSYDIVKAHGGELNVESNEGKGATFIMILPA